jgi:hypothetical protein
VKIKKMVDAKSFNPVVYEITFESQEELDEARGILNYSPITKHSKFLDNLAKEIGFDSNEFFYKFVEGLKEDIKN